MAQKPENKGRRDRNAHRGSGAGHAQIGIFAWAAMKTRQRLESSGPITDCIVYDANGKAIARIDGETRERKPFGPEGAAT